jgi:hypothetical protein
MEVSHEAKIQVLRPSAKRAAAVAAALMLSAALGGCFGRVSYNVTQTHIDPYFSPRLLNNAGVAVLPFLTPRGVAAGGELEPERVVRKLRAARPDMRFVSHGEFENSFPARFDRRMFAEFYGKLYGGDVVGVKAMDSLWEHAAQPYLLVYALRAGAGITNIDTSRFKHASVVCELWSREERAVLWRAACTGVSNDKGVPDGRLMAEGMRRLAEAIPPTAPNYGREAW